jgi:NAD(P)-dependent dehydrogenase (short-subunit alcohol dehydrogenase family)
MGWHHWWTRYAGRGGQAIAVPVDVADFNAVKAVAERAVAEYGRLDTWVHAAAVALYAAFEDTTPEEFARVVAVNLLGQVHGAMAALPHLKAGGGALVHVSSIEARRAFPFHSAYAASKHGIDGYIEALRVELRKEGQPVSLTQILPGSINTPLFNKARTKLGVKPMPPPPIYEPTTVAPLILYAAQHPVRELVAGGMGKQLLLTQRLSPRVLDALCLLLAFRLQKTDEPRSSDAPDNLFGAIEGYDRVHGDFGNLAMPRSLYNWIEMHPVVRAGTLVGAAAGVVAAVRVLGAGRGAQA